MSIEAVLEFPTSRPGKSRSVSTVKQTASVADQADCGILKFPCKDAPSLSIKTEHCKGCGLCVKYCPKGILQLGKSINALGYNNVTQTDDNCSGCGNCFYVCPEPDVLSVRRSESAASKKRAA